MQVYLDCDGVLANFEDGASKAFGENLRNFENKHGTSVFWKTLAKTPNFFANLDKMPDADELVFGSISLSPKIPIILTACPWGDWAAPQKLEWGAKYYPYLQVITTDGGENKYRYCNPGDILIDDYLKYKELWEEAGGIFIYHTSAKSSLQQLEEIIKQ